MSLVVVPIDELKEILRSTIKEELGRLEVAKESAIEPEEPYPPILKVAQLQKYLSIPRSAVYQLTHYKKIPFIKKGGTLFFAKDEVDKWIAAGKQQTIYQEIKEREGKISSLGAKARRKEGQIV